MIRLRSLRLQNFRSFKDSTINFPDKGMVLIQGRDVETGESSGTGKSAVLLGLAYALDILPPKFTAASLQNWDSDDPMQVTLVLAKDGKAIVLRRGKVTEAEFPVDEPSSKNGFTDVVKGAKSYPEALKRVFGVGPEILQALTYRAQRSEGFFLSMAPAQKIEFLTRVLGLTGIEAAVELASKKITLLSNKVEGIAPLATSLKKVLDELSAEPEPPPAESTSHIEVVLVQLQDERSSAVKLVSDAEDKVKEAIYNARKGIEAEVSRKNFELTQAQKYYKECKGQHDKIIAQVRDRADKLRASMRTLDVALSRIAGQARELEKTKKDLKDMEAGVCPTCKRQWSAELSIDELRERIAVLETEAAGAPVFAGQRKQAEAELNELDLFPTDPRLEKLRAVESKLQVELAALEASQTAEGLAELREEVVARTEDVRRLDMRIAEAKSKLREVKTRNEARESILKARTKSIEDAKKRFESAYIDLKTLEADLNAEKDFVAAMGREGFLGIIFEEVLQEIARETNLRLGRLANTSKVTVDFQTESDKGRRQIQTVVDIRGHKVKLETGPSGGMQTSIEQIVDLAVVTVVARRSGVAPAWLCLDEVSNGQGHVTFEAALEVFKEAAEDRLVLVIDHSTETKEAFSQTIDIEFQDGVSRVTANG